MGVQDGHHICSSSSQPREAGVSQTQLLSVSHPGYMQTRVLGFNGLDVHNKVHLQIVWGEEEGGGNGRDEVIV